MEHVVVYHLLIHTEKHNILSNLQHGFYREYSIITQLLLTMSDLAEHHDDGQQVDMGISLINGLKAFRFSGFEVFSHS